MELNSSVSFEPNTNAEPGLSAILPFIAPDRSDDALWLGALLARLLIRHLQAVGWPVMEYNDVVRALSENRVSNPPDRTSLEGIRKKIRVSSILYGRYVLDGEAKMLGLTLHLETEDVRGLPMEMSTPLGAFSRFLDRIVLAVLEQLGAVIDDDLRKRIADAPRPGSLEALRQLARAYAGWSRGQNELALAAVESALTLDSGLEEAAALQVSIAQEAEDATTVRIAFRRWSELAMKRQAPEVAAERLELMGHWMLKRGEWDEARSAYEQARSVFQRIKDEHGQAQVLNNLANLEILKGKYQNGIQTYRRNLRNFEEGEESQGEHIATLMNLSIAHKNLGQQEEALKAIDEALVEARRSKDSYAEGRALAQRGAVHDDAGHWAQAHADYSQAEQLLHALDRAEDVAMIKTHQGILAKQQGNYDQAAKLLLAAETSLANSQFPHERAVVWVNLADLYLSIGAYDQAWEFAERAEGIFSRLDSGWQDRVQDIMEVLESLPVVAEDEEEADNLLAVQTSSEDEILDVSSTVTFLPRVDTPPAGLRPGSAGELSSRLASPSPQDDSEQEEETSL